MKQRIKQHLSNNPSYFKWSDERLARKYGCSLITIRSIIRNLRVERENYLRNL